MNFSKIRVDIWSDFVCPFCYIGKRNFENALKKFEHKDKVEIVFRSFELHPGQKKEPKQSVHAMLSAKYGMSLEKAKTMTIGVAQQAKNVGLDFNFETMIVSNTFDAHRLAHFASTQNKQDEFVELALFEYFTNTKDLSDTEVLVQIALKVGLDEKQSREVLAGTKYSEDVKKDVKEAKGLGVSGVPYFLFNQQYEVSGAQPSQVFTRVLDKIWSEQKGKDGGAGNGAKKAEQTAADGCTDGSCKI